MASSYSVSDVQVSALSAPPTYRVAGVEVTSVQSTGTPASYSVSDVTAFPVVATLYFDGTNWVSSLTNNDPLASGVGTATAVAGSIMITGTAAASGSGAATATGIPAGPQFGAASGVGTATVAPAVITFLPVQTFASGEGIIAVVGQSGASSAPTVGAYYLYVPPTYSITQVIQGSLRYSVTTSKLVYKTGGQWFAIDVAGVGELTGADYYYDRPTIIPDYVASDIEASGVGGTLTLATDQPGVVAYGTGAFGVGTYS